MQLVFRAPFLQHFAALPGGYRKVFGRAVDASWQVVAHHDPLVQLLETDVEALETDVEALERRARSGGSATAASSSPPYTVLAGSDGAGAGAGASGTAAAGSGGSMPSGAPAAEHVAVRLEFTLVKSAYATVALREVAYEVRQRPALAHAGE